MNRSSLSMAVAIALLLNISAFAQQNDSDHSNAVAGVGIGTGVITGVLGIKDFSTANKLRSANTHTVLNETSTARAISQNDINSAANPIENGDEIVVKYHLNDIRNRDLWISRTRSSIASHESSAAYDQTMALTATHQVANGTDSNGNTVYTTEPDLAARMMYASMASSEIAAASEERTDLQLVLSGVKQAPLIELEKKFVEKADAQAVVKNFLQDESSQASKFFFVSRLPNEIRIQARNARIKGGVLTGIAVFSIASGVWELYDGSVSELLHLRQPKFSDYDSSTSP